MLGAAERQLLSLFGALSAGALHNARLLEQVRAGRKRLELLTHGLLESLERERRRIARELHDEIGQSLTAVHLNLQNLRDPRDPAVSQARLDDSLAQVERLLRQVRNMSLELRPSLLDDLGLAAALRWYLDRQSERAGLRIGFADGLGERRLTTELETTCFRVAQEAVNNVVRHAHAQNVQVSLNARGRVLELRVLDDGCGFDAGAALKRAAGAASLGLLGMREWVMLVGGRFEIHSSPGHGSEIRAIFSLDGARARLERRATRRA
jgi:signal transduction histidine kinase